MTDLKQKFVITQDSHFKMGRVKLHKELDKNARSGGFWFYDKEENTVYIYGKSEDFGQFTVREIDNSIPQIKLRFRGAKVIVTNDEHMSLFDLLAKYMPEIRAAKLIEENDWV